MHTTSGLRGPRWSVSCLLQGSEAASASGVGEMYSFTIVSLMSCSATMSNISAYILAAEGHGLPTWRSHSVVHILAAGGHGLPTWRSHSVVQLLWLAYNSPRFHFTIIGWANTHVHLSSHTWRTGSANDISEIHQITINVFQSLPAGRFFPFSTGMCVEAMKRKLSREVHQLLGGVL